MLNAFLASYNITPSESVLVVFSERLDGLLGSISIPTSPVHLPPGVVNPMPVLMVPLSTSDVDLVISHSTRYSLLFKFSLQQLKLTP